MTTKAHNNLTTFSLALLAGLWICTGCKLLPDYSMDEAISEPDETFIVFDSSALTPSAFATNSVFTAEVRTRITERIAFLDRFITDANTWFVPIAGTYLPSIEHAPLRRLIPTAGDASAPLVHLENDQILKVNLNAATWANANDVTTALRFALIQPIVERAVGTLDDRSDSKSHSAQTLRDVFVYGVSAYLSAFGMTVENSPLAPAMAGDRAYMEDLFAIVRNDVRRSVSLSEKQDAVKNVGLWMCYEIEAASGNDVLKSVIKSGPATFYEQYLTTKQGILLTLEPLPIQTRPVPDSFITH